MSFEIIYSNAFGDACAHREPGWICITGNLTKRLKAAVVCTGVTYCGPTMRVHAFMIRICVWHLFRAHGEIFWRCHNVARIAVMTRRAGRNLHKNGEREFEQISPPLIKIDHGLSRDNDFFGGISDRRSIDYFCYARTSNVYCQWPGCQPRHWFIPRSKHFNKYTKHTENIFGISLERYFVPENTSVFLDIFFIIYIRNNI